MPGQRQWGSVVNDADVAGPTRSATIKAMKQRPRHLVNIRSMLAAWLPVCWRSHRFVMPMTGFRAS